MILHCMKKDTWEETKDIRYFGEVNIEVDRFIHCYLVEYMWRVTPIFKNLTDKLVILCIGTNRLEPEVRWEDGDNYWIQTYKLN